MKRIDHARARRIADRLRAAGDTPAAELLERLLALDATRFIRLGDEVAPGKVVLEIDHERSIITIGPWDSVPSHTPPQEP